MEINKFLLIIITFILVNAISCKKNQEEIATIKYDYYKDNSLKHEAPYLNGKRNGREIIYNENGTIKAINDYRNGQPHGVTKLYHSNGRLKSIERFSNGLREGHATHYFPNGKIKAEMVFYKDEIYFLKTFDNKGNLKKTKMEVIVEERKSELKLGEIYHAYISLPFLLEEIDFQTKVQVIKFGETRIIDSVQLIPSLKDGTAIFNYTPVDTGKYELIGYIGHEDLDGIFYYDFDTSFSVN